MDKTSAIDALVSLGLSLGASRVYTALYVHGNLEATPLAELAGVPQSKVYSYLSSLQKQGIVSKVQIEGKPNVYEAVSYQQVIDQLRSKINHTANEVENYFERVTPVQKVEDTSHYIRVMQGDIAVRNGLAEIIDAVENNLTIIPNEYHSNLVTKLIEKRVGNKTMELTNYGELIGKIHEALPSDSPIKSKFQMLLQKVRPFILFTDVDQVAFTASSANFVLPPVDGMDSIFLHFRHPLIVNIQFFLMNSIFEILKSSQNGSTTN
ncbi:MAG: hypothetical protein HeimC2_32600 [Candidatus Heimdallarchaeota archaeon LC_2]|nr:MAG: hypothetical protein HeimC2_32600 [Candidatus Heimdallarchaeota archaeon LC_2]